MARAARRSRAADETTWPCNGVPGYVYGFFSKDCALYRFRRSGSESHTDRSLHRRYRTGTVISDALPDYPIPETAFGGQGAERVFMTGAGGLL